MQQMGMPPGTTMREAEMMQTSQFFAQMKAVEYSKHGALETCFEKCMDPEDLRTAYRRDMDERKRNTEHRKEKVCMGLCHKKFQKAYSMAIDGFRSSTLQDKLIEAVGGGAGGGLTLEKAQ